MDAYVNLRPGNGHIIQNLKHIKRVNPHTDLETCITEYNSFVLHLGSYIFIGDNILAVDGSDILSVEFR